jgi:hypothetical protein
MAQKPEYAMQTFFTDDDSTGEKPVMLQESVKNLNPIYKRRIDKMARLSEFGTIDRSMRGKRLEDVAGIELVITDFRLTKGSFGEYAFVDCQDVDGEKFTLVTGATFVLDALKDAKTKNALPVTAKFVKSGRAWMFE